ncbi:unnamed protein product [Cylindrotheca closterium]|uniref:Prolyl 4-hydroxylase alpha subunit domain-containing protein n=1 Tax=Cylindrotheca closterium TaxID=2856 RepID=A0AAD2CFB5_9STRA|nr:unnamed protein product [Cylindrotheca closterium]
MKSILSISSLVAIMVALAGIQSVQPKEILARKIEFVNRSGKKLVVEWVNPKTGEVVTIQDELGNGEISTLDTFVNHTFAIHEPGNESCTSEICGVQYVTVTENKEQIAVIKSGLKVEHEDDESRSIQEAAGIGADCRDQAKRRIRLGENPSNVMENLGECMEQTVAKKIQQKNDEIAFESQIRLALSGQLENHTCADPEKETSEAVDTKIWTHNNVKREVSILHDRPASQIHAIKNFISAEECDAISKAAAPLLHRGTVADGKGGSRLSDHRKAMQAGVRVPWERESKGDLIARVVRRLYDYTNDAVGYNLTVEGQEDLMSIQYFGAGRNSTESPDQYRPHCDGDCDGLPHKSGGRVATMVMYCDVEGLVGGATNFQNAGVYVKPELGAAAFFSYLDPLTMNVETGFTTHSGCPVIEGTKKIAVHWMRVGVDEENPWDSFNTLTIKKSDEEEFDD